MKQIISRNERFTLTLLIFAITLLVQKSNAQEYCISNSDQITGTKDGFRYELWNQNTEGTACMTVGNGALFSGEWDGILNYLARRGLGYDQTQEHQEYGRFFATYDCDYNPNSSSGNSYLSIYGWTVDPLIEFYIIEDWRNWIPSMAGGSVNRGSFDVNDGTYDIVENTRTNQPSIVGTATFQQYFSIRRSVRNSGSINISDHFEEWESLGLELGKLHEVSFVVEGYQSSGSFDFAELDVFLDEDNGGALATKESEMVDFFNIYPNPNSGNIFIQFEKPVSNASLDIYDISGKLVYSQRAINENKISITSLKTGLYFFSVSNDGIKYRSKILVN